MSQENLEFIIDNFDANKKFISELSLRMRRLRFGEISPKIIAQNWVPEHTLIISNNGVMLALADVIRTADGRLGNFSIVAKESCGIYAFIALLELKRLYPVETIEATFSEPTDLLVGFSKRWADVIYDQETWANARELTLSYGLGTMLAPTPLAISRSNQKIFNFPDPKLLDSTSKQQISLCCLNSEEFYLTNKSYKTIPKQVTMALGFEITNLELSKRQKVTRSILINTMQKYGIKLNKMSTIKKSYFNAYDFFMDQLSKINFSNETLIDGPIFKIETIRK